MHVGDAPSRRLLHHRPVRLDPGLVAEVRHRAHGGHAKLPGVRAAGVRRHPDRDPVVHEPREGPPVVVTGLELLSLEGQDVVPHRQIDPLVVGRSLRVDERHPVAPPLAGLHLEAQVAGPGVGGLGPGRRTRHAQVRGVELAQHLVGHVVEVVVARHVGEEGPVLFPDRLPVRPVHRLVVEPEGHDPPALLEDLPPLVAEVDPDREAEVHTGLPLVGKLHPVNLASGASRRGSPEEDVAAVGRRGEAREAPGRDPPPVASVDPHGEEAGAIVVGAQKVDRAAVGGEEGARHPGAPRGERPSAALEPLLVHPDRHRGDLGSAARARRRIGLAFAGAASCRPVPKHGAPGLPLPNQRVLGVLAHAGEAHGPELVGSAVTVRQEHQVTLVRGQDPPGVVPRVPGHVDLALCGDLEEVDLGVHVPIPPGVDEPFPVGREAVEAVPPGPVVAELRLPPGLHVHQEEGVRGLEGEPPGIRGPEGAGLERGMVREPPLLPGGHLVNPDLFLAGAVRHEGQVAPVRGPGVEALPEDSGGQRDLLPHPLFGGHEEDPPPHIHGQVLSVGRGREALGPVIEGVHFHVMGPGIHPHLERDAPRRALVQVEGPDVEVLGVAQDAPVGADGGILDAVVVVEGHLFGLPSLRGDAPEVEGSPLFGHVVDMAVGAPHGECRVPLRLVGPHVLVRELAERAGAEVMDPDVRGVVAQVAASGKGKSLAVEGHHGAVLAHHPRRGLVHAQRHGNRPVQRRAVEGRLEGIMPPVGGDEHRIPLGGPVLHVVARRVEGDLTGLPARRRHHPDMVRPGPVAREGHLGAIGREAGPHVVRHVRGQAPDVRAVGTSDPQVAVMRKDQLPVTHVGPPRKAHLGLGLEGGGRLGEEKGRAHEGQEDDPEEALEDGRA